MSCIRILLTALHSYEWIGILLARVAVGMLFFLSGRAKLFVPERREQMRQTLIEAHIPFSDLNAFFSSTVEFVGGFLLVIGALTFLVRLPQFFAFALLWVLCDVPVQPEPLLSCR